MFLFLILSCDNLWPFLHTLRPQLLSILTRRLSVKLILLA